MFLRNCILASPLTHGPDPQIYCVGMAILMLGMWPGASKVV